MEEAVDDCGTPVTGVNPFTGTEEFINLDPGEHTFTVRAFIVVNGVQIFDLSPASITWTIEEDDDNNGGPR